MGRVVMNRPPLNNMSDKNDFSQGDGDVIVLRKILARLLGMANPTFIQGDDKVIVLRKILVALKKSTDDQNDFSQSDDEVTILRKILARLATVTIS